MAVSKSVEVLVLSPFPAGGPTALQKLFDFYSNFVVLDIPNLQ